MADEDAPRADSGPGDPTAYQEMAEGWSVRHGWTGDTPCDRNTARRDHIADISQPISTLRLRPMVLEGDQAEM